MNAIFDAARWIAPREAKTSMDDNRTAWFRLRFSAPEGGNLRLFVTAHTRYKLFLNGAPIAVGPRKGGDGQRFFERVEVSDALAAGENELLAKVVAFAPIYYPKNIGRSPISVPSLPLEPSLLLAGGLYAGDKEALDLSTGSAAWCAANDESVEWIEDPQTQYIGAFERHNFARSDLSWQAALPGAEPYTNPYGEMPPLELAERTIPQMYEEPGAFARQMPCKGGVALADRTEIPPGSKVAAELDAGELRTAYMCLRGSGGRGARMRVMYAEGYSKGVRDEVVEGGLDGAYDELNLSGGPFAFESFWFRTFRFVRLEIETKDEALTLFMPDYRQTAYPLEVKSRVHSSAAWVEKLYDVSLRTLKLCMHETHEDCPFYEQLQYTSDTKLQLDFTYAVSGDLRMARQVIEDFHRSLLPCGLLQSRTPSQRRQVIPQFALYFVHMLDALHEQDGDIARFARYRPTVDAVLDYFHRHRGETGLCEHLGYWDFSDWVPTWEDGVPDAARTGPSAINNFVYAWTLQVAAKLMRESGRPDVGAEYLGRAEAVLSALRAHCFDEAEGLYREGPRTYAFSQHAQVFAVLSGALSGGAAVAALQKTVLRDDIVKCTYPMQFYLLRALEKVGRYDLSERVWRGFAELLELNLTTLPEMPVNTRSDCHAWSALMLYDAPRVWLGVRPASPGYREIAVRPQFLPALPDVSGETQTPRGPVLVRWARAAEGIEFSVNGPEGVPLVVELPGMAPVRLAEGGAFSIKL